jgi:hypothetical protein
VFSLLPPLRDWSRVAAGKPPRSSARYAYELILLSEGGEFRDAVENGAYASAIGDGIVG